MRNTQPTRKRNAVIAAGLAGLIGFITPQMAGCTPAQNRGTLIQVENDEYDKAANDVYNFGLSLVKDKLKKGDSGMYHDESLQLRSPIRFLALIPASGKGRFLDIDEKPRQLAAGKFDGKSVTKDPYSIYCAPLTLVITQDKIVLIEKPKEVIYTNDGENHWVKYSLPTDESGEIRLSKRKIVKEIPAPQAEIDKLRELERKLQEAYLPRASSK